MQGTVDAIELEEDETYVQMYSTEFIEEDFALKDFPRDSEEEQKRLKELGIFYLRDACDALPIFGEDMKEPLQCYYNQVRLNEDGTLNHFQVQNRVVMVEWIEGARVKRKFL